ncbi:MAG: SRPBCC domain-containing protein [Armatimonadota bacterium]|nr:SRPBCC domain-containing protein [Armatimonadota bacterium]MDR7551193.1 SRPBCC domain-containing protein [Armatimonadota bacterium]
MRFEHSLQIPATPQDLWEFLWQVEQVAACLPGCRDVRVIEPRRTYEAVLTDRVGPFHVQFPVTIQVDRAEAPTSIQATVHGKDTRIGSVLTSTLHLTLAPSAKGTTLLIAVEAMLSGRLGALGYGTIRRRADDVVGQFAANLERALITRAERTSNKGPEGR